jgi:hypothetical protein
MEKQIKERPILFSGPMVRALLAGNKTQHRAEVKLPNGRISKKPQAMPGYIGHWVNSVGSELWAGFGSGEDRPDGVQNTVNTMRTGWFACPYGAVGDRLWVQESFGYNLAAAETKDMLVYRADHDGTRIVTSMPNERKRTSGSIEYIEEVNRWHPAARMTREASRLLLEIASVRVERLQSINRLDAVQEGIQRHEGLSYKLYGKHSHQNCLKKGLAIAGTAQQSYQTLWNSINGPDSWETNPWVWVVTFKVIEPATPTIQEGASRE